MRLNDFGSQILCLVAQDIFSGEGFGTSDLERRLIEIANQAIRYNFPAPPIDQEIRNEFESLMRNLKTSTLPAGEREKMQLQLVRHQHQLARHRTLLTLLKETLTDDAKFTAGIFDQLFPGTANRASAAEAIRRAPEKLQPKQEQRARKPTPLSDLPQTLLITPSSTHTSPHTPGSQGEVELDDALTVV